MIVEGRYRAATHDWQKAVDVYGNLTTMVPDNLDYSLQLAAAETANANPKTALATLDRSARLLPPLGNDARISIERANAWHALGDFQQMASSLAEAARNAQAAGHRLLLARSRSQQCFAWRFLGEQPQAIDACHEALDIYRAAGDRAGEAETLRLLGDAVSESDGSDAMHFYEQASDIQNEIGHLWGQATVLNQMAILSSNRGDHAAAKHSFEKVLRICGLVDNKVAATGMMLNIASEIAALGKLREARSMFEKTLQSAARLGNKEIQGIVVNNIAQLDQLRGDLDEAQRNFQQGRGFLESVHDTDQLTVSINGMGEVAMYRGDFEQAEQLYQSALKIRTSAQQKIPAAESQLNLLVLSVEKGDSSASVEASLREIIALFSREKSANDEGVATSLLARILFSQSRFDEALSAAEKAIAVSAKADPNVRLLAGLTAAPIRVAARRSNLAQETVRLKRTIAEARRFGYTATEHQTECVSAPDRGSPHKNQKSTGPNPVSD